MRIRIVFALLVFAVAGCTDIERGKCLVPGFCGEGDATSDTAGTDVPIGDALDGDAPDGPEQDGTGADLTGDEAGDACHGCDVPGPDEGADAQDAAEVPADAVDATEGATDAVTDVETVGPGVLVWGLPGSSGVMRAEGVSLWGATSPGPVWGRVGP
jgi:hypothetical protein